MHIVQRKSIFDNISRDSSLIEERILQDDGGGGGGGGGGDDDDDDDGDDDGDNDDKSGNISQSCLDRAYDRDLFRFGCERQLIVD